MDDLRDRFDAVLVSLKGNLTSLTSIRRALDAAPPVEPPPVEPPPVEPPPVEPPPVEPPPVEPPPVEPPPVEPPPVEPPPVEPPPVEPPPVEPPPVEPPPVEPPPVEPPPVEPPPVEPPPSVLEPIPVHVERISITGTSTRFIGPSGLGYPFGYNRWVTIQTPGLDGRYRYQPRAYIRPSLATWIPSEREWGILVDEEHFDMIPGRLPSEVVINTNSLEEGWHSVRIASYHDEQGPVYSWRDWFFVGRSEVPIIPEKIPTWINSADATYTIGGRNYSAHAWVPSSYDPLPRPLPPKAYTPIEHVPKPSDLVTDPFLPYFPGDARFPAITEKGVVGTGSLMAYFFMDAKTPLPNLQHWDGPRGVCTLAYPTWLKNHGKDGSVDYTTGHSAGFISGEGYKTTLVGWRDVGPYGRYWDPTKQPLYNRTTQPKELVGDWSDCPLPHRFSGCWSGPFDPETTGQDSRAMIPNPVTGEEEERHKGPVVQFLNDQDNNRILRVKYDAEGLERFPPKNGGKVTEFKVHGVGELGHPWCVAVGKELYVADRMNGRILAVDKATGEGRVLVQGRGKDWIRIQVGDPHGMAWPAQFGTETLDQARQRCRNEITVAPEGLDLMDDWLYWGDPITRFIKRVNVVTGETQVVADLITKTPSFMQLSVSDGTFGPRHAVFVAHWKAQPPWLFVNGQEKQWLSGYGGPGPEGGYYGHSYLSAVSARRGRCTFGMSLYGLWRVRKATEEDRKGWDRRAVQTGKEEWLNSGMWLAYGYQGWSYHRHPLPEVSDNVQAYLKACGTWID